MLKSAHVSGDGNQKLISYSDHRMCHKPHHSTVYTAQLIPQKVLSIAKGYVKDSIQKSKPFTTN
jgi:hypothetical protein